MNLSAPSSRRRGDQSGLYGAAAVVLWIARDQFGATVQRASLPKGLATLSVLLAGFIMLGWGLVDLFPGSLKAGYLRLSYAARIVLGGAFSLRCGSARAGAGLGQ